MTAHWPSAWKTRPRTGRSVRKQASVWSPRWVLPPARTSLRSMSSVTGRRTSQTRKKAASTAATRVAIFTMSGWSPRNPPGHRPKNS